MPPSIIPYIRLARLDRPIGTWLLLFPCWWAIALAGTPWPDFRLMLLFALGAVVMRGAGCTLNDIIDRDYDARVERTRSRPLPSGAVTVLQALLFLSLQLAIGAAILLSLNRIAVFLGLSILLLVATYPFMKRLTYWPQLFLGLNFNWGAIMGWAAARGSDSWGHSRWAPLLLYFGGVAWTLGYDTIYAHQDKRDDARIGVKSSALALGAATRPALVVFYGTALAFWAGAGGALSLGLPFWIALALIGLHFLWQALRVRIDDAADCLAKFRSNRAIGWLMLFGILAAKAMAG